mmetsp:Transcript_288/g.1117  ORF Transcript_288/g.1117 Transcript_288/m.1117 type:complete len:370 (-) Transcript_288:245-1354(-)
MTEIVVRLAAVARGELVRKVLGSHAVYRSHVVVVRDRRVSSLYRPHRLREAADGGGRVEDDLGTVQPESLPVEGMVPPVAYVDRDLAEGGLEHRVPRVALHVVGALVEVAHSRDVVLAVLPEEPSVVADDDGGVPHGPAVSLVAFEYRGHDDHVPLPGLALHEPGRRSVLGGFGELYPRVLLPRAKAKRHRPRLLQAQDVHPRGSRGVDHLAAPLPQRFALVLDGRVGGQHDLILDQAESSHAVVSHLLSRAQELVRLEVEVPDVRGGVDLGWDVQGSNRGAHVGALHDAHGVGELLRGQAGAEHVLEGLVPSRESPGIDGALHGRYVGRLHRQRRLRAELEEGVGGDLGDHLGAGRSVGIDTRCGADR